MSLQPLANSYTDVKVCTLCSKKDVGDEYHYLLKCDYFDNERKTFIEARYIKHRTKHNFQELMKCRSVKNLRNLIAFIDIIIKN